MYSQSNPSGMPISNRKEYSIIETKELEALKEALKQKNAVIGKLLHVVDSQCKAIDALEAVILQQGE